MNYEQIFNGMSGDGRLWIDIIAEKLMNQALDGQLNYRNKDTVTNAIGDMLATYTNIEQYNPHPYKVLVGLVRFRMFKQFRKKLGERQAIKAEAQQHLDLIEQLANEAGYESVEEYNRLSGKFLR